MKQLQYILVFEKKRKENNANNFKSSVDDSTLSTNNVDIPIFENFNTKS